MKKTIIILTALLMLAGGANAQFSYNETNNLFYHTQRTPQTNMLNPALFPTNNSFYLQLPEFGFQIGIPMTMKDMIYYDATQDANIININNVLDKLTSDNPFRLGVDINVLGFGFKAGQLFFDFNTRIKTSINLALTGNIINAMLNGNMDENGNAISTVNLVDGNLFNAQSYIETSLGAGYTFPSFPLTLGAHVKLLSGIFSVQTENTNVTIETADDFSKVTARVYYQMMASAAFPLDTANGISDIGSHVGDIVKNMFNPFSGNAGLAFDFGVRYDLGPFSFSASINDLSAGIHWQNNVSAVVPRGGVGVFEFSGLELSDIISNNNMSMDSLNGIADKVTDLFPNYIQDSGDYWYNVPTKINLAASFNFLKMMRAGILLHGQFDRGLLSKKNVTTFDLGNDVINTFRFNTTASLGINLFNWAEMIVASSVVYNGEKVDLFNPGIGFIFTPATVLQTYVMADYVNSIYPSQIKAVNIKFGANLLIGNGGKKKIRDI